MDLFKVLRSRCAHLLPNYGLLQTEPSLGSLVHPFELRKKTTLRLRKRSYCLKNEDLDMEFLLPDPQCIPWFQTSSSSSHLATDQTVREEYTRFRKALASACEERREDIAKFVERDIWSMQLLFPNLGDEHFFLSLVATFGFMCVLDDTLETLSPTDALEAVAVAEHALLTSTPLPNAFTQLPATALFAEQMAHISATLLNYTAAHLPEAQFTIYRAITASTVAGLRHEHLLRQVPTPSVDAYLTVRRLSMLHFPFFFLVQGTQARRPVSQGSPALRRLEHALGLAVGLQNDLLGLPRDLASGDDMNYVLICARADGVAPAAGVKDMRCMEGYVRRGLELHDAAIEEMRGCWEEIRARGSGDDEEGLVADVMMGVPEFHAVWTATCKRWQTA